jgi:hypothetical protein
MFSHYLIEGTIFGKQVIEPKMCVLIFSTNLSKELLILRRIQRDIMINVLTCSCTVPLFMYSATSSYSILITLEFYRQVFEKYSNIRFHENPSSGRRVVPCCHADGQTDLHGEGNSRFSEFCERA